MANRIRSNVIIIDSAMGNSFAVPNDDGHFHYKVAAVGFYSADTTGSMTISCVDTSDIIVHFSWLTQGAGNAIAEAQQYIYLGGVTLDGLKVPLLTGGTGVVYLM